MWNYSALFTVVSLVSRRGSAHDGYVLNGWRDRLSLDHQGFHSTLPTLASQRPQVMGEPPGSLDGVTMFTCHVFSAGLWRRGCCRDCSDIKRIPAVQSAVRMLSRSYLRGIIFKGLFKSLKLVLSLPHYGCLKSYAAVFHFLLLSPVFRRDPLLHCQRVPCQHAAWLCALALRPDLHHPVLHP